MVTLGRGSSATASRGCIPRPRMSKFGSNRKPIFLAITGQYRKIEARDGEMGGSRVSSRTETVFD